jgi:hypothetical protein
LFRGIVTEIHVYHASLSGSVSEFSAVLHEPVIRIHFGTARMAKPHFHTTHRKLYADNRNQCRVMSNVDNQA